MENFKIKDIIKCLDILKNNKKELEEASKLYKENGTTVWSWKYLFFTPMILERIQNQEIEIAFYDKKECMMLFSFPDFFNKIEGMLTIISKQIFSTLTKKEIKENADKEFNIIFKGNDGTGNNSVAVEKDETEAINIIIESIYDLKDIYDNKLEHYKELSKQNSNEKINIDIFDILLYSFFFISIGLFSIYFNLSFLLIVHAAGFLVAIREILKIIWLSKYGKKYTFENYDDDIY